jgi:branched-chain amino acid transport system permease protein
MSGTTYYPPSGVYSDTYKKDTRIVKTKRQAVMAISALIVLFVIPIIPGINSDYALRLLVGAGIIVIICIGLNILTGYCGQLNIGQSAFVMIGAFTAGLLNYNLGWSMWINIIPSGIAAAVAGGIFGAPSVRLKGLYLALTTLAAQIVLTWIALNYISLASAGFVVDPPAIGNVLFDRPRKFYYIAMTFTCVMCFLAKGIVRSGIGRAFMAIRDNDIAAEAMGINIFRYKLLAFIICTFYAGVAGALFAHYMMWVQLESFTLIDSVWYLVMIIVGGLGSIEGTIFGVIFIVALKEIISVVGPMVEGSIAFLPTGAGSGFLLASIGVVAILFLILEPRGLAHRWKIIKSYYRLWPYGY